ncbi:Gp37 family protein [Terrimonas sp. NA20]|uniref:Gp37 family protein n=1 Tax=Terrimonas ginsenosidimutans TaxID=2908004 RepID=A0ABS9KRG8_9BACT|nr:Gp37 family protein [Terrimonas ginsenosidimutans]MCG2614893.1 Gp37 family protein [Terrimonas ginsenosidimutans]
MDYSIAEVEIVALINQRIQELAKGEAFAASVMPDTVADAKEYEKLFPRTVVAITYYDSNYESPSATGDATVQMEEVTFRALFEGQKRNGPDGVSALRALVKSALLGKRITNCEKFIISGNGNQQFDGGEWVPYLDFQTKTVNIEERVEQDLLGPEFKDISIA